MPAEAKEATDQTAATLILSLVRAAIRRDHAFLEDLLAAADPASTCRALLGFTSMVLIGKHGSPDRAVAEIDRLIRTAANGLPHDYMMPHDVRKPGTEGCTPNCPAKLANGRAQAVP